MSCSLRKRMNGNGSLVHRKGSKGSKGKGQGDC